MCGISGPLPLPTRGEPGRFICTVKNLPLHHSIFFSASSPADFVNAGALMALASRARPLAPSASRDDGTPAL